MLRPGQRIVSLVPSQTELLHHLGLEAQVVGITKFCVRPNTWFRSKTRVGGTKNVNLDRVRSLNPTLILANREENVKEQIEALARDFEVEVSEVGDFDSAVAMIHRVGKLTGTLPMAQNIVNRIESEFGQLTGYRPLRAAYVIWNNPIMMAGNDTFIHHMMGRAGFENILAEPRYPQISLERLGQLAPEVVLLSSEPFPFRPKHVERFQAAVPMAKVVLVDGEMFSWYGSRMLEAPAYFRQLRHELAL